MKPLSSSYIEKALEELTRLPGIGRKSAMRIIQYLLRQPPDQARRIGEAFIELIEGVRYCSVCHNLSDDKQCSICRDPHRHEDEICVVKSFYDVMLIEETGQYFGRYHVLGGVISPMEGTGPSNLHIDSLLHRLRRGTVREVIFALSPTDNDALTIEYIIQRMREYLSHMPTITTLSRGLGYHLDLEYADEVTLALALKSRTPYPMHSE